MLLYKDDGKVITMIDAMTMIRKCKKKDKYIEKLQEWHEVYNNLGIGWLFGGNCVAVRREG